MSEERLREIEDEFKQALDDEFTKDLTRSSRWSNWAGDIGFPCDTYQALCRLKGDIRADWTVRIKKLFRVGIEWEDPNYRLLNTALKKRGFAVVDRIGKYQWKEKRLAGRLDFRVEIPDPRNGKNIIVPLEHKTCSPNSYRSILSHKNEGTPLTRSNLSWVRKYPGQLTIYDLMEGSEFGMFFFFNKVMGDYFFWLQSLDFEYGEELIQRAERCNENVDKKVIPKPEFRADCTTCDFALCHCFPDRTFGGGFDLIDNDEILAKIKRMKELEDSQRELNSLKRELIGKQDKPGLFFSQNAVIGNYIIESVERTRKSFTIKAGKYWTTKIKELGGAGDD